MVSQSIGTCVSARVCVRACDMGGALDEWRLLFDPH